MNIETLVLLAETYSTHTSLKLSTVSTYIRNDGKFFDNLKYKRAGCTLKTANQIVDWFDQRWPADLEWPSTLNRPSDTGAAV